jgi:transposase
LAKSEADVSRKRVSMRKIREVLRLRFQLGLSDRDIAESCKIGKTTVGEYVQRAKEAGLSYPLPEHLDDEALLDKLYRVKEKAQSKPLPDWEIVHREKQRKGVTLFLLWEEYRVQYPNGYEYSFFTVLYREWKSGLDVVMRQDHKAGEKLFVDYAGMTVPIVNQETGEISEAQVFVATLGASNYTFAEITASQRLPDWLASHVRAFEFFGGVPILVIPDNLKSGVKSPCYYEPELNPAYADLAQHYGVAVLPARVRKPKDKAKVENAVQVVERQILAPLRDRTFFSVREANEAVKELLQALNDRPMQKLNKSRKQVFEELEKPALRPLPVQPYQLATWKKATVNIDYHVELEGHYYSVPYPFSKKQVEIRFTQTTVEIYHQHKRIASHSRNMSLFSKGRHTTIKDHMPKAHQDYLEWTPGRFISWAGKVGESTALVVQTILESKPHPQHGYRSCLGIMRLGKVYGEARLEAACRRACFLRSFSYQSIKSILQHQLDKEPLPQTPEAMTQNTQKLHANLRGASYYQSATDQN